MLTGGIEVIFRTSDGGKTWQPGKITGLSNQVNGAPIYPFSFASPTDGWAGGAGESLLHTTDGGQNWQVVTIPGNRAGVTAVAFSIPQDGWAFVAGGAGYHTVDGGKSWQKVPTGLETVVNAYVDQVVFLDPQHGRTVFVARGPWFVKVKGECSFVRHRTTNTEQRLLALDSTDSLDSRLLDWAAIPLLPHYSAQINFPDVISRITKIPSKDQVLAVSRPGEGPMTAGKTTLPGNLLDFTCAAI